MVYPSVGPATTLVESNFLTAANDACSASASLYVKLATPVWIAFMAFSPKLIWAFPFAKERRTKAVSTAIFNFIFIVVGLVFSMGKDKILFTKNLKRLFGCFFLLLLTYY